MIIDITGYRYTYTGGSLEHRIKVIQFSNGYEQRSSDGVNPRRHSWSVEFPAFREPDGELNNNLISLLDALLSEDVVHWISPYDITVARSVGAIGQTATWEYLTEAEVLAIRKTYSLQGKVDYSMLNDQLTSISCTLRRYYGQP